MRDAAYEMARAAQDSIAAFVQSLEGDQTLREDRWARPEGGGGCSRVLQDGAVFEKAGVNVSRVHGILPPPAGVALGLAAATGREFYATGVSVVLHPSSPMVPTVHCNYRYFEVGDLWWFGGGADLTPTVLFAEDAVHFHRVHRDVCAAHGFDYAALKSACDAYFRLPHRGECRGVGGIFFDRVCDRPAEQILAFTAACSHALVDAYRPIVERRLPMPFGASEKRWQQLRRGRYVEFNLLYDRGTLFGLQTGGRVESILMSLPLTSRWEYDHQPVPGSPEADLLRVLQNPVDWLGSAPAAPHAARLGPLAL